MQTYSQLALKYGVSIRTIQHRLDKVFVAQQFYKPKESIVLMDTTHFGREFGVMVIKDTDNHHLYWKFVRYETSIEYVAGLWNYENQGIKIKGIVYDGRKGLFKALQGYPVQMCQYHQEAIVKRY